MISWLTNLFKKEKRNSNPHSPLYNVWWGDVGAQSSAGEMVSVQKGTKTSVAFACINVLAQTVATLPYNVRRKVEGGSEEVFNQQYQLLHTRPNKYTTAFNFWYTVVAQVLSHGNSYCLIKRNTKNVPEELIILDPRKVKPVLAGGEVFYEYDKGEYIHQDSILHYYIYSFDGVCGVSPILWNSESFGYRIKQDKYKAKVMDAKPAGVLSFAGELTDEQMEQNRTSWDRMSKLAGTPVLSGDAKYIPTMISPSEGQMIEASEINTEEITSIYRVPPVFIQNYRRATFSNAEQQDILLIKHAITAIVRMIEQENDYKLFNSRSGLYTKFSFKAFLKGDTKTQAEWYRTMSNIGAMSPNDVRMFEDLPAIPDGDNYFIQGAMIPLSKIENFYDKEGNDDLSERALGFNIQKIKEGLDRLEIQNNED